MDRKGFTPSVQQRAKPVPLSSNPMVEAQSRLHVSAVPEELPCREEEFAGQKIVKIACIENKYKNILQHVIWCEKKNFNMYLKLKIRIGILGRFFAFTF